MVLHGVCSSMIFCSHSLSCFVPFSFRFVLFFSNFRWQSVSFTIWKSEAHSIYLLFGISAWVCIRHCHSDKHRMRKKTKRIHCFKYVYGAEMPSSKNGAPDAHGEIGVVHQWTYLSDEPAKRVQFLRTRSCQKKIKIWPNIQFSYRWAGDCFSVDDFESIPMIRMYSSALFPLFRCL